MLLRHLPRKQVRVVLHVFTRAMTLFSRNRIFRTAAKHHKSEKMTELMQSVRIRQAVLVKSPQHRLPSAIRCAEGASELVGQEVSGPASAR